MGMFDTIICEYTLPDGFEESKTANQGGDEEEGYWQTKSLDCLLEVYTIHSDGRMTYDESDYELCKHDPPHTLTFFTPARIAQCPVEGSKRTVDTNYHGWVEFYGQTPDGWREYAAKFTNGTVEKILGGLK